MATGGNFTRTLMGGDEPICDFPCSLCEGEGNHVEPAKYCEECFVYLCDPCLRSHNKYPLHKRHRLLDQSQFTTVKRYPLVSFPTKRCLKHPVELINIFCGDHDVVCCSICKVLEHSSCVKTQHLPDAAIGIEKSKQYKNIKTGTRSLISELDKMLNDQKLDISRIDKESQHVRQTIAEFRTMINKYFDDLEKNTLDELDHREKTIARVINGNKKFLETTKTNAEDILKQLGSFKGDNECDLFVHVKTGLQFLNDTVEKLRDMCKTYEKPFIHFEISRSIKVYISSLKMLGSYSSITQPVSSTLGPLTSSTRNSSDHVSLVLSTRNLQVQHSTYKAQYCGKFDVKEKSDTETSEILNICQLPNDKFLITDWLKIKRLDESLELMDYVQMSDCPHSVCVVSPVEAAMSMCLAKKIQFASLGKKLRLTRSFTVDGYCREIVYIGNELFVCCGYFGSSSGCIEVYNNAGKLQRTIPRAPQRLYSRPCYITASDDGQHLLFTSRDNDDITLLDLTGNVVNTFNHNDLKSPTGICTDGRGQVFVCGYDSNNVIQLSPEFQQIEVILSEADGIKNPVGVCYGRRQSRLKVSCAGISKLAVFTLK